MSTQTFPSLNDIAPSWADITVTASIDGGQLIEMADIAAIKWDRQVEVGEQRGASGGRVMKRTTGSQKLEGSVTLYRSGLRRLIRGLYPLAPIRGNQRRISLVAFDFVVQHTPQGGTDIYETHMKGCRYLGDSDDMKEGPEADKIEVNVNPIEIAQIVDGFEIVLL